MPQNDSIAITGEGIVCAIGTDKESVLHSLLHSESGVGAFCHLRSIHHELPVGEVPLSNDELKESLGIPTSKLESRTTLLGMAAARQAIREACLTEDTASQLRIVLISGTTVGGMDITEHYYPTFDSSDEHLPWLMSHSCGSSTEAIASHFGIFSESTTISTACSSAANAILLGAEMLKAGEADIVVAGGSEALSIFHLNGFNSLMILDKERCRPFDAQRAGLNLGEGAAYVVMETATGAQQRGAHPHAYLTGWGNACDAYHQTASSDDGEGAFLAMQEALGCACIAPSDISYVNAHGTGTPNNDLSESHALRRIFGTALPPTSSTKAFTGHTTSASGSIEAVICLLAMRHHFIPANLGWHEQMPDGITPCLGQSGATLRHVLCNSFGFGGNDTALIFSQEPLPAATHPTPTCGPINVVAEIEITSEDQLQEIRQYVKPLEARRMGKLMKSALLSSLKALDAAGIDKPDAIITATSMGCLENSERLLDALCTEGEAAMKPTLFMQSTHNTASSAIAIHTRCHGYNITYSHGMESMEWALRDARRLLSSGRCKNVLVGCHDETTPHYRQLMERLGISGMPSIHSKAILITCGR